MKRIGMALFFIFIALFVIPLLLLNNARDEGNKHQNKNINLQSNFKIKVYRSDLGKIEEMDFEKYIAGVIAGEMPVSFHIEALKAQALAARTYTLLRLTEMGGKGCIRHPGADICTDPAHCQAWRDPKSIKKDYDKLLQAVGETRNEVIVYRDSPIDAVFHSTSGGRTENSEDIWPNKIPYLRSVMSQFEKESPKLVTKKEITIDQFIKSMKELCSTIKISKKSINSSIKIIERSEGGRITKIQVGNQIFKGSEIQIKMGLNSSNFSIDISKNTIIFTVKGNGHGIGMSQYGADGMAKNGASYQEIIKHYYQGVEIISISELLARNGQLTMNKK